MCQLIIVWLSVVKCWILTPYFLLAVTMEGAEALVVNSPPNTTLDSPSRQHLPWLPLTWMVLEQRHSCQYAILPRHNVVHNISW